MRAATAWPLLNLAAHCSGRALQLRGPARRTAACEGGEPLACVVDVREEGAQVAAMGFASVVKADAYALLQTLALDADQQADAEGGAQLENDRIDDGYASCPRALCP